jgi:endonuclease YncB( thermonuclease family)
MKCAQILRLSFAVLLGMGLILATSVALSAPRGRGSAPGPKPMPKALPKPIPKPLAKPLPKALPKIHVGPKVLHPIVVPKYKPRPVVRVGATVVIAGTRRVIRQATPTVVVAPPQTVIVPSREFTQAEVYQVIAVGEDYVLSLWIDGRPTLVRMLGVEPPLVAAAEGLPGMLPDEALRFVQDLLVGEYVYLDDDSQVASTDADGIRVAYVYRAADGLPANLEIIKQGYGLAAEGYAFEHSDTFAAWQTNAEALGKGIWAGLYDGPAQD